MAIRKYIGDAIVCLAADTKPSNVANGARLYESDTKKQFLRVSAAWQEISVTVTGQSYLSLSGQQITANAVDLSGTHVTGILAASHMPALTGDVTSSSGAVATTIAAGVVTFAKLATAAWSDDTTLAGDSSTVLPTQHATKTYVDSQVAGLKFKQDVKAAPTANITLSGAQTIDGVSVVVSDRVLVKDQTTGSENGVYVVASGSWTRAADGDTGPELVSATFPVRQGTVNADTWWTVTNDSITVGSTALTFSQTAGAGTYTNGSGLTLTGNSFSISAGGVTNTMLAGSIAYSKLILTGAITNADLAGSIAYSKLTLTGAITNADLAGSIAASKLVGTDIVTVGTITAGTWHGAVVDPTYGGTGINNGSRTLTVNTNSGILDFTVSGKTLSIAQNLTLTGATGKVLTLTNSLTVSGNDGTISFSAASTTLTVANNASVSGTNTGDITLTGSPNYITLSGQQITVNAIDLSTTNVTGTLAAGRFPALAGHVTTSAGSLTTTIAAGVVTFAMLATSAWSDDTTLSGDSSSVLPTQHATKTYVDTLITGLKFKVDVRVASTANITVSNPGTATFDGVTLSNGDRILLKNQTTGSENGVYIFNGSGVALTRATDGDTGAELISATFPVRAGTANQDTWWTVTNDTITIGSTAITFSQTGGAGTYTNGAGITLTGNSFSIGSGAITSGMLATWSANRNAGGNSLTNIGQLSWGTAATDVMLKKHASTAELQVRMGDDTNYAGLKADTITGVVMATTSTGQIRFEGGPLFYTGGNNSIVELRASTNAVVDSTFAAGSFLVNTTVLKSGSGTPEAAVSAPVGSVFLRTNGAPGTAVYIKESGSGNTGWTPVGNGTKVYRALLNQAGTSAPTVVATFENSLGGTPTFGRIASSYYLITLTSAFTANKTYATVQGAGSGDMRPQISRASANEVNVFIYGVTEPVGDFYVEILVYP